VREVRFSVRTLLLLAPTTTGADWPGFGLEEKSPLPLLAKRWLPEVLMLALCEEVRGEGGRSTRSRASGFLPRSEE
jgi:hypothetical protein